MWRCSAFPSPLPPARLPIKGVTGLSEEAELPSYRRFCSDLLSSPGRSRAGGLSDVSLLRTMCSSLLHFLTRNFLAGKSVQSDWFLLLLCLSVCLSVCAARSGCWHCWQRDGRQRWRQQTTGQRWSQQTIGAAVPGAGLPGAVTASTAHAGWCRNHGQGAGEVQLALELAGASRRRQLVLPRSVHGASAAIPARAASPEHSAGTALLIPGQLHTSAPGSWGHRDGTGTRGWSRPGRDGVGAQGNHPGDAGASSGHEARLGLAVASV